MSQEKIKISLSVLTQQVNQGMKKAQLAEYYGLKQSQMTKVLQSAGLKIRKFHAPVFELLDDTVVESAVEEMSQVPEIQENPVTEIGATDPVFEENVQENWN